MKSIHGLTVRILLVCRSRVSGRVIFIDLLYGLAVLLTEIDRSLAGAYRLADLSACNFLLFLEWNPVTGYMLAFQTETRSGAIGNKI